jgi:GTP-binding protein HflX
MVRLEYMAPRLRETQGLSDRQRGGIGGKGAGESQIELDRRKLRDRIAELRDEIVALEREHKTRSSRRQGCVAWRCVATPTLANRRCFDR